MPKDIYYSDNTVVRNAVPVVWEDLNTERSGCFRAFWAAEPTGKSGCPVIGYCSPGGSHRTIKAVAREVQRYYPGEIVYRNGKPVKV